MRLMAHSTVDGAGRRMVWKHVSVVRMGFILDVVGRYGDALGVLREDTCGMWILGRSRSFCGASCALLSGIVSTREG
jgi:hypothetical protein